MGVGWVRVVIVGAPGVADIVARCTSDNEVADRSGRMGRGFTNLKRILGNPRDFDVVVEELAKTVPQGHALAGADEGSWALVGALALRLGVFLRSWFVVPRRGTSSVKATTRPWAMAASRASDSRREPDSTWWMTWCIPRPCALPLMRCVESISPARRLPQSSGPDERRHQQSGWKRAGSST